MLKPDTFLHLDLVKAVMRVECQVEIYWQHQVQQVTR